MRWVAEIIGPCQRTLDYYNDFIKTRLDADPNSVPGFALKPGAVKETVSDAQACFERFITAAKASGVLQTESGQFDQEAANRLFMDSVTVAKGALKESLAVATGLKGLKLKAELDTLLLGITESKQSAPSLVKVKE